MIFVNYAQAAVDVREWSRRLPSDIICVVGIPRSGAILGVMLAEHRNICYADLHQIIAGDRPWEYGHRRNIPPATRGTVLFVDDTVYGGRTIRQFKARLPQRPIGIQFAFGALYCKREVIRAAPLSGRELPHIYHSFEWNLFHDVHAGRLASDLDGVICEDWGRDWCGTVALEETDRYLDFLENTRPIRIPSRPLAAIITARLEKHRPQTEAWLRRWGIEYKHLMMNPSNAPNERRGSNAVATVKARQYKSIAGPGCRLFVDDSETTCRRIAKKTGLPTLNPMTMTGHNLESMGGWYSEATDKTGIRPVERDSAAARQFARLRVVN